MLTTPRVELRTWSVDDLPLLQRLLGEADMMQHLGGPESPEKIRARNERYARSANSDTDRMLVILATPERTPAGSVLYWERQWDAQTVWEAGWHVIPEFQGMGIASEAVRQAAQRARLEQRHRYMHAFPAVANVASNAVCRKTGFVLRGECDFEYPPGHMMRCNDWRLDLSSADA
jgi:RimJ/RimL family protein N-acetyltransferase